MHLLWVSLVPCLVLTPPLLEATQQDTVLLLHTLAASPGPAAEEFSRSALTTLENAQEAAFVLSTYFRMVWRDTGEGANAMPVSSPSPVAKEPSLFFALGDVAQDGDASPSIDTAAPRSEREYGHSSDAEVLRIRAASYATNEVPRAMAPHCMTAVLMATAVAVGCLARACVQRPTAPPNLAVVTPRVETPIKVVV
jgi:hypothetical protein